MTKSAQEQHWDPSKQWFGGGVGCVEEDEVNKKDKKEMLKKREHWKISVHSKLFFH